MSRDGDAATGWRPHDDPQSPVLIQPGTRFGRPAVKGISTQVLWEHERSGEMPEEIAAEFGLSGRRGPPGAGLRDLRAGPGRMNRPAKSATTRFDIDADLLGLTKVLVQIRPDVTYPGTRAASTK